MTNESKQSEAAGAKTTDATTVLETQPMTDEEAEEIFELFDTNNNGSIDVDELVVFVCAIKERDDVDRAHVMEVWDRDRNGQASAL